MIRLALIALLVAACSPPAQTFAPHPTAPPSTSPSASPSVELSESPEPSPARNPAPLDDPYAPIIEPAAFTTTIDNPFLPLVPGTLMTYEGEDERVEFMVTPTTREVMDVTVLVVIDKSYEEDALVEDTEDWFAQDDAGNVWYFGEDTAECEDGKAVSRDGAWTAGVDGAQPGVVMLADPEIGDVYRQEYLAGEAEDQAEVIATEPSLVTPAGTFDDILVTLDTTPLEPDQVEHKRYAADTGQVETRMADGSDVVALASITKIGAVDLVAAEPFEPCAS